MYCNIILGLWYFPGSDTNLTPIISEYRKKRKMLSGAALTCVNVVLDDDTDYCNHLHSIFITQDGLPSVAEVMLLFLCTV
jgi:hypothetical protein